MDQEYFEVNLKVQELKDKYETIEKEMEVTQIYIKEAENLHEENEKNQHYLMEKLKKIANSCSTSCLVQTIAILFCVFIILLLKL